MRLCFPSLLHYLEDGFDVVFPSTALAEIAGAQWTQNQLRSGRTTWERPAMMSVNAWLANRWHSTRYRGSSAPALLSPVQERKLWMSLFAEDCPQLFDCNAAARMAMEAAQAMAQWRISLDADAWEDHEESSRFRDLHRKLKRLCRERDYITRSDLWALAPKLFRAGQKRKIVFAGFESWSPALASLMQMMPESVRLNASFEERAGAPPVVWGLQRSNIAEQIEAAARWARKSVETEHDYSVGVLVNGLTDHLTLVTETFESIFYPRRSAGVENKTGLMDDEERSAFHINAADGLAHHPLIAGAMLILKAAEGGLPTSEASALVRSPYLSGAREERSCRALGDIELRKKRDVQVTLNQIIRRTSSCPLLHEVLKKMEATSKQAPRFNSLSGWSDWMADWLAMAGWPGDGLKTIDDRLVDSLNEALSELSSLAFVTANVPYEEALRQLEARLRDMSGPQRGDWFSPVQILDARLAGNLYFDAVAGVDFSEGSWPIPERRVSFIPLRLQRQAGLPGTDLKASSRLRAGKAKALFASASEVLLTYSAAPAPLIRPYLNGLCSEPELWQGDVPLRAYAMAVLDRLEDEMAPQFAASDALAGGVSIIKAQSLCPFQAFARYRLLASIPEEPSFGFDARDRGGYLHKVLEFVWNELRSSEALHAASDEQLKALIARGVDEALKATDLAPFQQLVNSAERERLEYLVSEWLTLEKVRGVAFRVEGLEEKRSLELAGLRLNLRVDRIDRLADGSVLLVDYKSGQPSAKDLCGDRPREPQLLLYAAAMTDKVDGVYLAQVRAHDVKAVGLASRDHFPGQRKSKDAPPWEEERKAAAGKLYAIACEFVEGRAAVNPQPGACAFCELDSLCRIAEWGTLDDAGGDERI